MGEVVYETNLGHGHVHDGDGHGHGVWTLISNEVATSFLMAKTTESFYCRGRRVRRDCLRRHRIIFLQQIHGLV